MTSLYDLNPTTRFSDRVVDYVRYRPSYPSAVIDAILAGLGDPFTLMAADVGAGTGISARLLADRGVRVCAVEPNADMQSGAEAHTRVMWQSGTAESTSLGDSSVALVLCAQAFHWFRHAEALAEFFRILKPGGRLALMWNWPDVNDPFTAGYRDAINELRGESVVERREHDPSTMPLHGQFSTPQSLEFTNAQGFDLDGLLGRARSASYVPKDGPRLEALQRSLTRLYHAHADAAGQVWLRYETQVFLATRMS